MGKPTICIGVNKGADQLRSYCEADLRLCFRYTDSTIPLLSISKFPASNQLYSPVCFGPGQNPNCWFSHAQAHFVSVPALGMPFLLLPVPVCSGCKLYLDLHRGTVSTYAHLCLSFHREIQNTVVHAVWVV